MITKVANNVYRGPRPTNMGELTALGVKHIMNLEVGWFEFFHQGAKRELDMAHFAGVECYHLPMSDWFFPSDASIRNKLAIIDVKAKAAPIYVHCLHGEDRTGLICAAYKVTRLGWDIDQAIQEMLDLGFHKVPYDIPFGWLTSLICFLSNER